MSREQDYSVRCLVLWSHRQHVNVLNLDADAINYENLACVSEEEQNELTDCFRRQLIGIS
jgi:hypothetical protein